MTVANDITRDTVRPIEIVGELYGEGSNVTRRFHQQCANVDGLAHLSAECETNLLTFS